MTQPENAKVSLELPARSDFLPLVQDCVEKGAALFGLKDAQLMGLNLAVEEIFLHLCRVSRAGEAVALTLVPAPTGVDVRFSVPSGALRLGGLNIVAADAIESLLDQEDFNQIGLLLAAGFIDFFSLQMTADQRCLLNLRQERGYPAVPPLKSAKKNQPSPPFRIVKQPSSETLQQACLQVAAHYPSYMYAVQFRQPGKFADLVRGGELQALVVEDAIGTICGMLSWVADSGKAIRFHGPYVFVDQHQDISTLLVEECISRIARTRANIMFTTQATEELPMEQFETLGTLSYCPEEDSCVTLTSCYRHLREDRGLAVWSHPDLEPFLRSEYERLVLLRDIRLTGDHGAGRDDNSVFGLDLDKESRLAIIRPLLDGRDIGDNLALHLTHLVKRQVSNVLCIIDLGLGWQAAMSRELLQQGFVPRLIEPLAGKGDCVVFQYAAVQS
jgi:hypothetical protein